MTHFVSASCEGELCTVCKAPAQHKLGEEIPSDDPSVTHCQRCQQSWKRDEDGLVDVDDAPAGNCADIWHDITGPARHNLTAYVCCAHFAMIVGDAGGCAFHIASEILRRVRFDGDEMCGAVVVDHCHWWGDFYGPATSKFLARALAHRFMDRQGGDLTFLQDALLKYGVRDR